MRLFRIGAALVLASAALLVPLDAARDGQQLPSEPMRQFGASVTGAFEGWYDNPDGSHTFLVGYLNRNFSTEVDVPIGPNNRIEPGGPDQGQPSHFLPGRQYGMFTVTVPKEFTPQQRLTWTIVANGQSTSIPLRLHTDYVITPFSDVAVGNTPPILRFAEDGPSFQGPVAAAAKATPFAGRVGQPVVINLWAADDERFTSLTNAPPKTPPPPVRLVWSKYRGPGDVTFESANPPVEKLPTGPAKFNGKSAATARFSAPGEYMLHVTANDLSGPGGGGEVCCWSTAIVKVTVNP